KFTYGVHVWGSSTWSKKSLWRRVKSRLSTFRPKHLRRSFLSWITDYSGRNVWLMSFIEKHSDPHRVAFIRQILQGGDFVIFLDHNRAEMEVIEAIVGPFGGLVTEVGSLHSRIYNKAL